ncbi:PRADC1-like protein isoform X2 [Cimex lectularius]|uniref:PA domain-containing protein n=1 Tax=Cimex lectularius TaxID=79782 RepID=A0A8I6RB16_CIMLE|nr:PRADC1-like protein isoform X2 [Cimex lectularius]
MEIRFVILEILILIDLCRTNLLDFDSKWNGGSNLEIIGEDIFFEILEPESLRYTYRTRPAKNFGAPFTPALQSNKIKLVPVEPANGCSQIINVDYVYGNVALIERGSCSFLSKTSYAEKAGAKAVIIADNVDSEEFYTEMIDDDSGLHVKIPATFLLGKNGFIIRRTLQKLNMKFAVINIPVNVTYVPLNQWKQPPWLTW